MSTKQQRHLARLKKEQTSHKRRALQYSADVKRALGETAISQRGPRPLIINRGGLRTLLGASPAKPSAVLEGEAANPLHRPLPAEGVELKGMAASMEATYAEEAAELKAEHWIPTGDETVAVGG